MDLLLLLLLATAIVGGEGKGNQPPQIALVAKDADGKPLFGIPEDKPEAPDPGLAVPHYQPTPSPTPAACSLGRFTVGNIMCIQKMTYKNKVYDRECIYDVTPDKTPAQNGWCYIDNDRHWDFCTPDCKGATPLPNPQRPKVPLPLPTPTGTPMPMSRKRKPVTISIGCEQPREDDKPENYPEDNDPLLLTKVVRKYDVTKAQAQAQTDWMELKFGDVVMDMLAGTGNFSKQLLEAHRDINVLVVESNKAFLLRAKNAIGSDGFYCTGNTNHTHMKEIPDNTVDHFIMSASAAYLPMKELEKMIDEVLRILEPDGDIMITGINESEDQKKQLQANGQFIHPKAFWDGIARHRNLNPPLYSKSPMWMCPTEHENRYDLLWVPRNPAKFERLEARQHKHN